MLSHARPAAANAHFGRPRLSGRGRNIRPGGASAVDPPAAAELKWGYAIRREWPDGTHDLVGFSAREGRVRRRIRVDERFWRQGPVRPSRWLVVPLNGADVRRHDRSGCQHVSCPNEATRGGGGPR